MLCFISCSFSIVYCMYLALSIYIYNEDAMAHFKDMLHIQCIIIIDNIEV